MLRRLQFSNFKAWRHVDLNLARITALFGTNSAGKSSLIQFLLMLKQTREATDRRLVMDFGSSADIVNLGGFNTVVHRHENDKRISWLLDWTTPKVFSLESKYHFDKILSGDSLQIQCEVGMVDESVQTYNLCYSLDDAKFEMIHDPGKGIILETKNTKHISRGPSYIYSKHYIFPDQVRRRYRGMDYLGKFELGYEQFMDSIYYLGPLRDHPQREYRWSGSSPSDVGQRGERVMEAILSATRNGETRNLGHGRPLIPFQEAIARQLKELGLIHDFRLNEIREGTGLYEVVMRTSESSVPTALMDVGIGVSQVLPALVLLYYVPNNSIVLLEQPELHLHPAAQGKLADIMLDVALTRGIQVVVETHSEHLMRRLQRRVAEEKISPEDVEMYFVSMIGKQAEAVDLSLNEWGEIENWPEDFFGDEFGEISAITEAGLRRRERESG